MTLLFTARRFRWCDERGQAHIAMHFDNTLKIRCQLTFLLVISVALGWVLLPYAGAFLWAVILAIIFHGMWKRILGMMPRYRALAAFITMTIITLLVIVPAFFLVAAITQQVGELIVAIQQTKVDPQAWISGIEGYLPDWGKEMLREATAGRFDPASANSDMLGGILSGLQNVSGWLLAFGQGAATFILQCGIALYLLFYFLMDDGEIIATVRSKGIFPAPFFDALTTQFAAVVRGTVTGGLLVAIIQGAMGGIILYFLGFKAFVLLGVLMAIGALIPAIGTGLVWVPVALYLVATGDYGKAAILAFCGFVVIGSVDNILRPILVGKSTKIPDFLVLVTTLGGVDLFGPNGLIVGPMIAGLFLSAWATIGNREIGEAAAEDSAADAAANARHETAYPASSTQPPDSAPPEAEPT